MKHVLFIFGTRPEVIKMAPVVRQLKSQPDAFKVKVCVTAQHREMLDQVLKIFGIKPDYDLNLMRPEQTLFDVTADVIRGLEEVLKKEKPDVGLVQGDATTVVAVDIGGVEAVGCYKYIL